MLSGLRSIVAGKKTYLIAFAALIAAVLDWHAGGGGAQELVNAVWGPAAAMTVRAGIAKGR